MEVRPWFTRLAPLIEARLKRSRYLHSLGVMHTAMVLSHRYGGDLDAAGIAGLIHDCCKETPRDQLRAILDGAGWDHAPLDEEFAGLWHAWAGEVFARSALGITDPDVLLAVRHHPTGHPEMTPLQAIVFLADYMEPTRRARPDVEEIRALAREDLDGALLEALERKADWVGRKAHAAVHPWSRSALAAVARRIERAGAASPAAGIHTA